MKTKPYFRIAFLLPFITTVTFAQKEISVNAVSKQMSRGVKPGFQVDIPESKLKDVKSAYEKQLEQNTKVDVKEIAGEMISYGAVNKNFSPNPFIVYSKFLETPEGVTMTVFVTEDSVSFISDSSDADKLVALKKSIHDFAVTEYKKNVTKRLDVENDKLKGLKKDLQHSMDDESDNLKSIGKKQREIENYTTKIETNKTDQAAKVEQVKHQESTVKEISDKKSPEYELANKNLKRYQSEKKSLEKDAEKMGRGIDDNNASIKELEYKNEELKKKQEAIKEKVEAQEAVVKAIQDELDGIK